MINTNSQVSAPVQAPAKSAVEQFCATNKAYLKIGKDGKPCQVINRKEYGLMVGKKGAELKREHNKLVIGFNTYFKPAALAALGQDGVVVKKFGVSHGTAGTFIEVKALLPANPLQTVKGKSGGARKAPALTKEAAMAFLGMTEEQYELAMACK